MFLDNLLPSFVGVLAAPLCFIKRIRYPNMVSFGLLANLSKMKSTHTIKGIDSIWDVGANQGQFAFMAHTVWPEVPKYSFEPDANSYEKLKNNFKKFGINGQTFSSALSDKVESKELIRYENNVNNSLLENASFHNAVTDKQIVECTTLDNIFMGLPEVNAAFLKLDVQGFELVVLAGAKKFLERCRYVQVEISFSPTYSGGAHAGEVMLLMRDSGFECIEILDLLREKNVTNHITEADLLFKRMDGS